MILSGQNKPSDYRMRNEVRAFINSYYEDGAFNEESSVPVDSFIKAKEVEFCATHGVSRAEFGQRLLNEFCEQVALKGDELESECYYSIAGMFDIWRELEERES